MDGDGAWTLKASVYINLNPIRTARFGLAKAAHKGETKGWVVPGAAHTHNDMRARNTFQNPDEVKLSSLPVKIGNEGVIVALPKRAVAAVEIQLA